VLIQMMTRKSNAAPLEIVNARCDNARCRYTVVVKIATWVMMNAATTAAITLLSGTARGYYRLVGRRLSVA
jgi:hypothetical protein